MTSKWLIRLGNETIGPLSDSELRKLAEQGGLNAETPVSREPDRWISAREVDGLCILPPPPAIPASAPQMLSGIPTGIWILLIAVVAGAGGFVLSRWLGTGLFATCGGIFGGLLGARWALTSQPPSSTRTDDRPQTKT
jgi:hypothetical protein